MKYDVRHDAALAVVKTAATQSLGYQGDIAALTTALATVEGSLANSAAVVAAIEGYVVEEVNPQLAGILGHTSSAVTHTSEAISYYVEGSVEMATAAARRSATVDLPAQLPGAGSATSASGPMKAGVR